MYLACQRIMILIGYFFLLATFVLITFELNQVDFPAVMRTTSMYFACEQDGIPNSCACHTYLKYTYPHLSNVAYVLVSFLTFVHLLYVMYVMERCCQRWHRQAQFVDTVQKNKIRRLSRPMQWMSVPQVSPPPCDLNLN